MSTTTVVSDGCDEVLVPTASHKLSNDVDSNGKRHLILHRDMYVQAFKNNQFEKNDFSCPDVGVDAIADMNGRGSGIVEGHECMSANTSGRVVSNRRTSQNSNDSYQRITNEAEPKSRSAGNNTSSTRRFYSGSRPAKDATAASSIRNIKDNVTNNERGRSSIATPKRATAATTEPPARSLRTGSSRQLSTEKRHPLGTSTISNSKPSSSHSSQDLPRNKLTFNEIQRRVKCLEKRCQNVLRERNKLSGSHKLTEQQLVWKMKELKALVQQKVDNTKELSVRRRSSILEEEVLHLNRFLKKIETDRDNYRVQSERFQLALDKLLNRQNVGTTLQQDTGDADYQSNGNQMTETVSNTVTESPPLTSHSIDSTAMGVVVECHSSTPFNSEDTTPIQTPSGTEREDSISEQNNIRNDLSNFLPPGIKTSSKTSESQQKCSPGDSTTQDGHVIDMSTVQALRAKEIENDDARGISFGIGFEVLDQLNNLMANTHMDCNPLDDSDPVKHQANIQPLIDQKEKLTKLVQNLVDSVQKMEKEKTKTANESFQMEAILRKTVAQLTNKCDEMKRETETVQNKADRTNIECDNLRGYMENVGAHIEVAMNALQNEYSSGVGSRNLSASGSVHSTAPAVSARSQHASNTFRQSIIEEEIPEEVCDDLEPTSGIRFDVASPVAKCFALVEDIYPRIKEISTVEELKNLQKVFEDEVQLLNEECGYNIFRCDALNYINPLMSSHSSRVSDVSPHVPNDFILRQNLPNVTSFPDYGRNAEMADTGASMEFYDNGGQVSYHNYYGDGRHVSPRNSSWPENCQSPCSSEESLHHSKHYVGKGDIINDTHSCKARPGERRLDTCQECTNAMCDIVEATRGSNCRINKYNTKAFNDVVHSRRSPYSWKSKCTTGRRQQVYTHDTREPSCLTPQDNVIPKLLVTNNKNVDNMNMVNVPKNADKLKINDSYGLQASDSSSRANLNAYKGVDLEDSTSTDVKDAVRYSGIAAKNVTSHHGRFGDAGLHTIMQHVSPNKILNEVDAKYQKVYYKSDVMGAPVNMDSSYHETRLNVNNGKIPDQYYVNDGYKATRCINSRAKQHLTNSLHTAELVASPKEPDVTAPVNHWKYGNGSSTPNSMRNIQQGWKPSQSPIMYRIPQHNFVNEESQSPLTGDISASPPAVIGKSPVMCLQNSGDNCRGVFSPTTPGEDRKHYYHHNNITAKCNIVAEGSGGLLWPSVKGAAVFANSPLSVSKQHASLSPNTTCERLGMHLSTNSSTNKSCASLSRTSAAASSRSRNSQNTTGASALRASDTVIPTLVHPISPTNKRR